LALSGVRLEKLDQQDPLRRRGMSGYLLPFVIISMHLLTVLIGAGYMARTKRVRTGRVLEAAPRTVPANRKFNFAILGGIFSGLVTNVILIALSVAHWKRLFQIPQPGTSFVGDKWGQWLTAAYALPNWFWVAIILTLLANILFLVVVYNWQKWGLIGLVAMPLLQFLLMYNAGVGAGVAGILALAMFVPAVLLVVLCITQPRPTAWSQME
jgi:hypothetical protein